MKTIILFALFVVCVAAWQNDAGSVGLAQKQNGVNQLLFKINDNIQSKFTDMKQYAERYIPEDNKSYYTDKGEAVTKLSKEIKDHRVLQQNHWFSLFNNRHREETLMLFETLINARSWKTFISTAAHYREKLNEGVFVYGFYVAIIHSKITKGIILPPLYEITPHMFTNSEVIQEAYSAKMKQLPGKFKMAFTGSKRNPEQRVAYFGEDIGLNVHHVTWHMDFPFWWKDSYGYHLDRKGELFFWVHHQLTARFDAERLSNHLDLVDELHWDKPIYDGFAPHTSYKYGGEFPARPDNVDFDDVDGVCRIRDMITIENRIRDAIAHGYVTAKDGSVINIRNNKGIEILGDILESSEYSSNVEYYGSLHNLAHIILGRQGDPHGKFAKPPGVMEHFETATRDPAFFRLHKYIDNIFKEHKYSLPAYTSDEIEFSGIAVESLSLDHKLETFFEDFEFEIGNGVDDTEKGEDHELIAVVSRLNHVPFHYNLDISNNNGKDVLATIRIYLCPSRDANNIRFTWENGIWSCVEMDKFWRTLHHGDNKIERSSTDSSITAPDMLGFRVLTEETNKALSSGGEMGFKEYASSCGIPNRLLLPKGNSQGMEFDLLVAVTDGGEDAAIPGLEKDRHLNHGHCGIQGEIYPDKQPMGYPFDRHISDERIYTNARNIHFESVKVYHRN